MNLALRNPKSGTEPDKDKVVPDQDARHDEARVSANSDRRADVSAKESLNGILQMRQNGGFYLRIEQFHLEIHFKSNTYGPRKHSRRQAKDKFKNLKKYV